MDALLRRAAVRATSRPFLINALGCALAWGRCQALFWPLDQSRDWWTASVLAVPSLTRLRWPAGSAAAFVS